MSDIINKVAQSGLITIDLEDWWTPGERVSFDIAPWLVEGLLLREKDFRDQVSTHPWQEYAGKHVAVFCTTDAIIPRWAWMLITTALTPYATTIVSGSFDALEVELYRKKIQALDPDEYRGQRVVIKGCSHKPVPTQAYVELTRLLQPLVQSILYGEPCSTVPVYKRPKG
jgi:hypothetical protein